MESTYGDRDHDSPQDIDDKLSQVINDAVKAGGNVIIPTFAIERAQELLYHFSFLARAKRIPYIVTFLDSPMAVEITKVFEQSKNYFDKETLELFKAGQSPFEFPGLKLVESVEGSKAINLIRGSTIIMAGSGMITGGRIKHHLVREITIRIHASFCGIPSGWDAGTADLRRRFSRPYSRTILSGADKDREC